MADLSIGNATSGKIDTTKWKKLTPQEIIKEESKGEEIPAEIINWAQQMAAFSKIPDNVTYEQVDGDTGLEALDKLGIEEEAGKPELENAQAPSETEEPDAVRDPAKAENLTPEENNLFMPPEQDTETLPPNENEEISTEELGLADTALTTDPEEIRKRKERKGLA